MKIVTVINQKGGVGKSTTANALGQAFLLKGKRVLYIDLDAQGNLTKSLGGTQTERGVASILFDRAEAQEAIQETAMGDLIPSSPTLVTSDRTLAETGSEYRLKEALSTIQGYDIIMIDTPPSLGTLTINALTASDGVIIPAQADSFSLDGTAQLRGSIEAVRKYCNRSLRIYGIVLTRFNPRTVLSREVREQFRKRAEEMQTRLFSTEIRESVAIKESLALRSSLFKYAKRSAGAKDYLALADEVMAEINRSAKHE